jgi:hypothetical protein
MTSPYAPLRAQMNSVGLTNATPGWQIVAKAKLLPPTPRSGKLIGDADSAALRKLMKSYYEFGRQHWTWAQSSPGSAANGGLVKGSTSTVACGGFNWNFKWLAENALGIAGVGTGQDTAEFITVPGGVCIDHKWQGNVRTTKQDFGQFKCFKFHGHYWVTHGGANYDVCFNNIFGGIGEIIWTKLDDDPTLARKSGLPTGSVFKLEKKLPHGDHQVMLQKNGPNGWPSWKIATEKEVAALGK